MESSDMKNMVEEAIIIFKENQKVREKELIERGSKINSTEIQTKSKDYILKEAEMLVTDYIKKIENKKKFEKGNKNIMTKYKILKYYSVTSTILLVIRLIINFV